MNQTRKAAVQVSIVSADDHPPPLDDWFQVLSSQTLPAEQYEIILVDSTRLAKPSTRRAVILSWNMSII